MSITRKEASKMMRLAKEGKQIDRIQKEDFPEYSYEEIYLEVYAGGERSSRGIKKMISMRLERLISASKPDRQAIVKELNDLVWHLYDKHKSNQAKIDKIRKALNE